MEVRVLIADDEEDARELMKVHIGRHPNLSLVGVATDGAEAVRHIQLSQPDLVFLDIQMPELSGLEVVTELETVPEIIFVTAYDEFAVRAFELNALDYLLKPFTERRFDEAIDRFTKRIADSRYKLDAYLSLLGELGSSNLRNQPLQRISYRSGSKTMFLSVEDILLVTAADQYVEIHTASGKYLVRQSMDYLESRLDQDLFFRTHRSAIIRLSQVQSMEQYEPKNALVHLKNGMSVRLSQGRKQLFQAKLGFQ